MTIQSALIGSPRDSASTASEDKPSSETAIQSSFFQRAIRVECIQRVQPRQAFWVARMRNSGERTRLACWRSRPRDRGLFKDCFGETPKPARETRALPRSKPVSRLFQFSQLLHEILVPFPM